MPLLHLIVAGILAVTSVSAPFTDAWAAEFSSGFAQRQVTDPVEGGPMPVVVFYPTATTGEPTRLGPYTLDAVAGAPPSPGSATGRFPLIVLSHGTGGDEFGHHDSLTALARAGFVAATLRHPRDNFRDSSGFGTNLQTIGRAHHMVALIDALLADPQFGPMIDPKRIGIAGHSAGGYTALLLVGGRPDPELRNAYGAAVKDDPYKARYDAVTNKTPIPGLKLVSDQRIGAAFLMAPALGYLFDAKGLADISAPIRISRAGADREIIEPWSAERLRQLLPVAPEYQVIDNAGHFIFLSPCTAALAALAAPICADAPGLDRVAIHTSLNAEMVDFFRRTLR